MGYTLSKVAATIADIEIVVRMNSDKEPDPRAKARFEIIASIVNNAFKSKKEKINAEKKKKTVNTIV